MVVAGAAALILLLALPTAGASADSGGCYLFNKGQLKSIVGYPQIASTRATADSSSPERNTCDWGLWRGSAPKGQAAVLAKGIAGEGAQVGYESWAPGGSEAWIEKGFEDELNALQHGRFEALVKLPGVFKPLSPNGEGYSGTGATLKVTGPGKGLEVAVGCWWEPQSHSILCLLDEEAVGKPTVAHLNALAAKAVPAFFG